MNAPPEVPSPEVAAGDRDRGVLSVVLMLFTVVCLAGGALVVDGGRAMAARRHAAGTAEASARYAVATQTISELADRDTLRRRATEFALRSGVAAADLDVTVTETVEGPVVSVTVTERRTGVFAALVGADTLTVHATGRARSVWSG